MAETAGRQFGVVSRQQLLAIGLGRRAIGARLERGALHRVHRGVYAVGHPVLGEQGRWMAAVLAGGIEALLSHRSAARLWGLIGAYAGRVELTRPTKARQRSSLLVHTSRIPEDERTVVEGIPVTTPPRTILDLTALLPERRLEAAVNEMEVRGLTDRLSIHDLLERYPVRRGTATLRRLLAMSDRSIGVTRSELEERFLKLIDRHGLPRPRLNVDLAVAGRFFRPDCLWPDRRVIAELDGRAAHGTSRAFERDRERDRILMADGWQVVRITWQQLHEGPERVAGDLRRLLVA